MRNRGVMVEIDNRIDEKKVFIDLFDIYEQELLTIFQYVAPVNNTYNITDSEWNEHEYKINFNVSWNKIHELHLRVCAECENLMKLIAQKIFPERDFDWEYRESKSMDIKELNEISQESREKIKKSMYKHADMPFYLEVLNDIFWICDKKIEFLKTIETIPENQITYTQPLERNNNTKIVPKWWENYNKLKHDKINNYTMCTLENLINSLGAYYILLNYLIFDIDKNIHRNEKIKSKLFKPTIWRIVYPQKIREYYSQFREDKISQFFDEIYIWTKEIIPMHYNENLKNEIQILLDESHNNFIISDIIWKNKTWLSGKNYLYYNVFEQQWVVYGWSLNSSDNSLRKLKVRTRINFNKNNNL